MQSMPNPKLSDDPHDVLVVPPDAVGVAPSDDELSSVLQQAARHRADKQTHAVTDAAAGPAIPSLDTTFRPSAANDDLRPRRGWQLARQALRGLVALLLAAIIGVGAFLWRSYGDAAEKKIAKWTTQFVLTAAQSPEQPASAAPAATPAVAANAASPQPATPAQPAAETVTPGAGDSAQLQSMARELASLGQEVQQLKASLGELKANQQTLRDAAKASDPNLRARVSAPPQRPAATARPHKPAPSHSSAQAAPTALPPAPAPYYAARQPDYSSRQPDHVQRQPDYMPRQIESPPPTQYGDPELASVPRPPMPLR